MRRPRSTIFHRRILRGEQLERRELLDGQGLLWGADSHLSLSFVPDGAKVGDATNSLFSTFGALASEEVWQEAILQGFQTWARQTSVDIGVVDDDGSELGIAGATIGDPRFGDIRVTAIPMAGDIFARSIPTTEFVDGTWVGDVFFNSNAKFENVEELFAVALHEAGHVFGLDHVDDPESPLYQHNIPVSTTPTVDDLSALQSDFGLRQPDAYEQLPGPAVLKLDPSNDSVPAIVFGSIHTADDVDTFVIQDLDDYEGPLTIRLVTDEISLLRARLSVSTAGGKLLGQARVDDTTDAGQEISVTLSAADENYRGDDLIVQVESETIAPYDVGSYTVVATLFNRRIGSPNSPPDPRGLGGGIPGQKPLRGLGLLDRAIESIARSRDRTITQEDIQRFFGMEFEGDAEFFANEDHGSDDKAGAEVELKADSAFPASYRYVATGAISNPHDVDRYRITVPATGVYDVMTVSLVSLSNSNRFRGEVIVRNHEGNTVDMRDIINSEFSAIAQLSDVRDGDQYTFEVHSHDHSRVPVGNYILVTHFGSEETNRKTISGGTLNPSHVEDRYDLRVNRTQMFQFGLEQAGSNVTSATSVRATILDSRGGLVDEITSLSGGLSTLTILLPPDEYSVLIAADDELEGEVTYLFTGSAVDEPLGPEPVDPTEDAFCGYEWLNHLVSCARVLGDVDGDGQVAFSDFLNLSHNFGRTDAERADGDLNGDWVVDFSDFLILSLHFGTKDPVFESISGTPVEPTGSNSSL